MLMEYSLCGLRPPSPMGSASARLPLVGVLAQATSPGCRSTQGGGSSQRGEDEGAKPPVARHSSGLQLRCYTCIPTLEPDTMQHLAHLLPPTVAALLITASWIGLHAIAPAVSAAIYSLLTRHPWLVGAWLALSVIGLDYALTAARNTIGFRNVGSKALAHFRIGGRQ